MGRRCRCTGASCVGDKAFCCAMKNGPGAAVVLMSRTTSRPTRSIDMKYGLAFLLGVPVPILAIVWLVSHC